MKNRIKELRKNHLHLNQEEFGNTIGISRSNIANIESGRVNITERNIKDICSTYNINETWLRTGEGEMFVELPPEDEYFKAATELSMQNDKIAMQAVIEYWKLDDQSKELFRNFLKSIVKNSED